MKVIGDAAICGGVVPRCQPSVVSTVSTVNSSTRPPGVQNRWIRRMLTVQYRSAIIFRMSSDSTGHRRDKGMLDGLQYFTLPSKKKVGSKSIISPPTPDSKQSARGRLLTLLGTLSSTRVFVESISLSMCRIILAGWFPLERMSSKSASLIK